MKIRIVTAPGVGDALIFQIAAHNLRAVGHEVEIDSPHSFGNWFPSQKVTDAEAIFLQHDNSERSKELHALPNVYTFYGAHREEKHGPLRPSFDYVCNLDETMVDNVVKSLKELFKAPATPDTGLTPPEGLIHRKHRKRVAIHHASGSSERNWHNFTEVAIWLKSQGYEPAFLPQFPTLSELLAFIYESGYFVGNDSGPGHAASLLQIPHLIIGREERHMRHWRPGWKEGTILTPSRLIPNWKGLRMRENHWKSFISVKNVINSLKTRTLIE